MDSSKELGALLGWIGASFEQEDGPSAQRTQNGLRYSTLRFAAWQDGSNWSRRLLDAVRQELVSVKERGAVKLIWRVRIGLHEDAHKAYVRCRVVAVDREEKEVPFQNAVPEGAYTPTLPNPDVPLAGYDFQGPKEEAVVLCGMICHNVVKALNDAKGELTIGWDQNRASVVAGIMAILDNPALTPEESHLKWMEWKTADGWKYGPEKDPVLKTHPLMVPFEELPPEQKVKDAVFGAIVRTFFGI